MRNIDTDVIHPARASFITLFDSEGDALDVYPEATVRDEIFRRLEILDREFPNSAPHTAWEYDRGEWHQLKERIHSDHGALRPGNSVKKKP